MMWTVVSRHVKERTVFFWCGKNMRENEWLLLQLAWDQTIGSSGAYTFNMTVQKSSHFFWCSLPPALIQWRGSCDNEVICNFKSCAEGRGLQWWGSNPLPLSVERTERCKYPPYYALATHWLHEAKKSQCRFMRKEERSLEFENKDFENASILLERGRRKKMTNNLAFICATAQKIR